MALSVNTSGIPPTPLLEGIPEDEQTALFECLNAQIKHFGKGVDIFREQDQVDWLGIILSGAVEASRLDMSGKRLIISRLGRGSVFGDVLSLSPNRSSLVTVTALEDVSALLIPASGLYLPCMKRCAGHYLLIRNLLKSVSEKYFELQDRLFCVTRPKMREKIIYFLESVSGKSGSGLQGHAFTIPFDRAALAEYLNVDRSALSRELSAMKRGGLIDYHKNTFRLL